MGNNVNCRSFIFIINGNNGVGKDFFIKKLQERLPDYRFLNISTIDFVKDLLKRNGIWDGKKDDKGRRLLAEIKQAITNYSDFINDDIIKRIWNWKPRTLWENIVFIHCREPEQIKWLSKRLESSFGVHSMVGTILILRDNVEEVANNEADKNVENYKYDMVFKDASDEFEAAVTQMVNFLNEINPPTKNKEET